MTQPPAPRLPPRTGILLANLGSPAEPSRAAVRLFLDEFLGDPLVVDAHPLLWWIVRKCIILPLRSKRSAELYRSIWMPEGSPILVHSEAMRAGLAQRLGPEVPVVLGMRYGEPSLERALGELERRGVREIRLLSLFPQASRTTSGTIEARVRELLAGRPSAPRLSVLPPFPSDPGWIAAVADSFHRAVAGREIDHVVFSLHGLPVRYVDEGDPYRDHCEESARALAAHLELDQGAWTLAYQSRFGREPWLAPDTVEVVRSLARDGARVAVLTPGFIADCLETLEEIGLRLTEAFREAGGEELTVVPCLNSDPKWLEALERLVSAG